MSHNPILDEIHATRSQLLQDAGGDMHRYITEATERALASGRPIAAPIQREPRLPMAENPIPLNPEQQSSLPTPQKQ